jgi:hypothetical protein
MPLWRGRGKPPVELVIADLDKKYGSQSPVSVGLIKVPLITELPLRIFQKIGSLVL